MNDAKMIEALKAFKMGIDLLISAYEMKDHALVECPAETSKKSVPEVKPAVPVVTPVKDDLTDDDLKAKMDKMTYTALKSFAKEFGVSGAGQRDAIVERILAAANGNSSSEPAPVEKEVVPPVVDAPEKKSGVRSLGKKKDPEPEIKPEPEIDEDDKFYKMALDATDGMTDEEIMEYLIETGLPAKGKRQSLIATIARGLEDGKIELDDEEDSSDEESVQKESAGDAQMTPARKKAIDEMSAEVRKQFQDGEISKEELVDWYAECYPDVGSKGAAKLPVESILSAYIAMNSMFIDDDGESHEEGEPYVINGENYCCGELLKAVDSTTFKCECCGETYEMGED